MRVLNLRLKNLNSLVGEWSIDFTHPDYEGNGVFAIIGPTGAGKSTLLDAICLALYGRTPRLDKITKNSNELMARQTGECSAEVTFQTLSGIFRCTWKQHRSRKKAEEPLQEPCRELIDVTTNKILETGLKKVDAKVEEITGMDFHRFTRSMMLAQGDFDAFLKAPPTVRAAILEQITGMEIYASISKSTYERAKEENQKLDSLHMALVATQPLSDEDENNCNKEFEDKTKQGEALQVQLKSLNEMRAWRVEVDAVIRDLALFEQDWTAYLEEERAAKDSLQRFDQAMKALGFEADFRDLRNLKSQLERSQNSLQLERTKSESLAINLTEALHSLQSASESHHLAVQDLQTGTDLLRIIRDLDRDLLREQNSLKEFDANLTRASKEQAELKKIIQQLDEQHAEDRTELDAITDYCHQHISDETLVEKWSAIKENIERLKERRELLSQTGDHHASCVEALQQARNEVTEHRTLFEKVKGKADKEKNKLDEIAEKYVVVSEGKDSVEWDEVRKTLESQQAHYKALKDALEAFFEANSQWATLQFQNQELETAIQNDRIKAESVSKELEQHTARHEELKQKKFAQHRLASFEADRSQLCDKEPCPLCGSVEHPYVHGYIPDFSHIDMALKEAQKGIKGLENTSKSLDRQITANETLCKTYQQDLEKQTQLKDDALKQCQALSQPLDTHTLPSVEWVIRKLEDSCSHMAVFEAKRQAFLTLGRDQEKAQKAYEKERQAYTQVEAELRTLESGVESLQREAQNADQVVNSLRNEIHERECLILDKVTPYGILNLVNMDLEEIKNGLQERLDVWKDKQHKKALIEKRIQAGSLAIEVQNTNLEGVNNSIKTQIAQRETTLRLIEQGSNERLLRFGTKDTDEEEKRLKTNLESTTATLDISREFQKRVEYQKVNVEATIEGLLKEIHDFTQRLSIDEERFLQQIKTAGFSTLEDFNRASLTQEKREELNKLRVSLERKKSERLARKEAAEQRLQSLQQIPKTNETQIALQEKIDETSKQLDSLKEAVMLLRNCLIENEKKKETTKGINDKIQQQAKESDIWGTLCSLIGSANGQKFRDFAQKMTLDRLLVHANRHLIKMSNRYLLKQSRTSALELEVMDDYQASEERSVNTLSGGESFIVSLALALGLSQMNSHRVRIDTLFLDEGFGTLDEQALEVALDALSGLHQEGKVIGLISHVTALKERVSTQIMVQPISGGRSRIVGPGCQSLSSSTI